MHEITRRLALLCVVAGLPIVCAVSAPASEPVRDRVLIYYGNGTHLTPEARRNLDALTEVLSGDKQGRGAEIASILSNDAVAHPAAVDEEISAIRNGVAQREGLKLLVFSNSLSARGRMLIADGTTPTLRVEAFDPARSENYISASHPNSLPETLRRALATASQHFDPKQHIFTLITKSHSDGDHVLIPRVTLRHETVSADEIIQIANSGRDDVPPWSKGLGTTGPEYLDIIRDAGARLGMKFDLVVAETCAGRATLRRDVPLPTNVSTLFFSSEDLPYRTLDYRAALADANGPTEGILSQLTDRYPADVFRQPQAEHQYLKIALWWLPLLVLVVAWLALRRRKVT